MSDPTLSDIDFKNEMTCVWTTLDLFFYNLNQVLWGDIRWCNMSDNISECPISSSVRIYISKFSKSSFGNLFGNVSRVFVWWNLLFYVTRGILSKISFEVILTSSDVQNLEHLYLGFINQFLFNTGTEISHTCVIHNRYRTTGEIFKFWPIFDVHEQFVIEYLDVNFFLRTIVRLSITPSIEPSLILLF